MQIANLGLKEWYNTPADMWAAGCVLAEMIESVPAFPASSGLDLLHRITCLLGRPDAKTWNMGHFKINTQLSAKSKLSTSFEQLVPRATQSQRDLLRKLLVWDPRDRLSAKAALKHFVFDNVPDVVNLDPKKLRGSVSSEAAWEKGQETIKHVLGSSISMTVVRAVARFKKPLRRSSEAPRVDVGLKNMQIGGFGEKPVKMGSTPNQADRGDTADPYSARQVSQDDTDVDYQASRPAQRSPRVSRKSSLFDADKAEAMMAAICNLDGSGDETETGGAPQPQPQGSESHLAPPSVGPGKPNRRASSDALAFDDLLGEFSGSRQPSHERSVGTLEEEDEEERGASSPGTMLVQSSSPGTMRVQSSSPTGAQVPGPGPVLIVSSPLPADGPAVFDFTPQLSDEGALQVGECRDRKLSTASDYQLSPSASRKPSAVGAFDAHSQPRTLLTQESLNTSLEQHGMAQGRRRSSARKSIIPLGLKDAMAPLHENEESSSTRTALSHR